jgi:hypothetical protein
VKFYNAVFLLKSLHQFQVLLQSDKKKHALHTNTYIHLCITGFYNSDSFAFALVADAEETSEHLKTKSEADYAL